MNKEQYPIGRFQPPSQPLSQEERLELLRQFESIPSDLENAVSGLTPEQLDTPARSGGWTARQLAHHIPDSHLNGYVRMKWGLTEESPTIKPYDQNRWSELKDVQHTPVEVSLTLLTSVHARWAVLMRNMSADDFQRTIQHPESGTLTLDQLLALYVWHGRHHIAQIRSLVKD